MPLNRNLYNPIRSAQIGGTWTGLYGPVNWVSASGTPTISIDYALLSKCNGIQSGTVTITAGSYVADDLNSPGVLQTASTATNVGTISSYSNKFIAEMTFPTAIPDETEVFLAYTDVCGNPQRIRIGEIFTSIVGQVQQGPIDTTVQTWGTVLCPIDFCNTECLPQLFVNGLQVAVYNSQGVLEITNPAYAERLLPSYTPPLPDVPNATASISFGFYPGLPATTNVELKICDDVYPLNDCRKCCDYTVNTTGLITYSITEITSVIVSGNNVLSQPITGSYADIAALVVALNTVGIGTFTNVTNTLQLLNTPNVLQSITVVDGTGTVTLEFTRTC